jgi:hypothetical protein
VHWLSLRNMSGRLQALSVLFSYSSLLLLFVLITQS